jgi:hypothetical protein
VTGTAQGHTLSNGPRQYIAGNAQAHGSFNKSSLASTEDHQNERPKKKGKR